MKIYTLIVLSFFCAPLYGADWLQVKNPNTNEWETADDGETISFDDKLLEFRYLIERNNSSDRGAGAILLRVVRNHSRGSIPFAEGRAKTFLTRNPFPDKAELRDGSVDRQLYERYHRNQIEDLTLRNEFHALIPPSLRTNDSTIRDVFRYLDPFEDSAIHRSYLFYYEGIREGGSLIDFNVGVSSVNDELKITAIELNPPLGVGLVQRSVVLRKE